MKIYSAALLFVAVLVSLVNAQTAPTIASISSSRVVTQGESLSLSVSVNGTAPFTYVWKKDGTTIPGATTSTLGIEAVSTTDTGSYTVTITNASGSITSGSILIDVSPATAPSFYYIGTNLAFTIGDTISIHGNVSGSLPMTFEWKKDTTTIATGTSNYYSKANAQAADAGTYTVTATNAAGSTTSPAITVTVAALTAPVFQYGPSNYSVDPGDYITFHAYVTNSNGVTYQWYKDEVLQAGSTSSSYSKSNAVAGDAGSYTVVATNAAGSTTSTAAILTVRPPAAPTVSISSDPVTVTTGESLSLYGSANGTSPLTYQWRKDGADIPGATSYSYYKANITAEDTGTYSLVVTNSVGTATSASVSVSVSNAQVPVITRHPASVAVHPDSAVAVGVNATGTGNLIYQWKKDGVNISNATASSFWINSTASSDAGVYTVVVTNAHGSTTSQPANVVVLPPLAPTIAQQPAGVSLVPGQSVYLSVEASGFPAPTYQWKKDSMDIVGATSSYYSKSNVASSDSGSYTVAVMNSAGAVTSQAATVNVGVSAAPVILSHPASGSLLAGETSYNLSIQYDDNQQGATVQWYRNDVEIPGAVWAYYTINNAQPSSAGTYKAVVTTGDGLTATSRNGVITVDLSSARPTIIHTSGSRVVPGGHYASLSILLSPAVTAYTVAWKKDGVVVPNATELYINLSDFSAASAGTYTAEVTTSGNTFTSQPIILSLLDSGASPRITAQPASQTRPAGQGASFSVYAVGERPLTYEWYKEGVLIPNATNESYSVSPLTAAHAGNYLVVVTNRNGSATSSVASLTVNAGTAESPVFAYHPASLTLTSGSSYWSLGASLVNPTHNETFKWYKDGVEISGATSRDYSYSGTVSPSIAGRYKVTATNSSGTTTSEEAIVSVTTIATGPVISTQPVSQTGYSGSTISFSVAAITTSTISYQWRKNGAPIAGATGSTLILSNVQSSDAGSYTVVIADADGSISSSVAELTVVTSIAPIITTQPGLQVGVRGGSASFSVVANGTPAPTYQWRKNGSDVAGATNATLSWSSLAASDEASYSVVVSNPGGTVMSNSATLMVFDQQPFGPAITTHPQSGEYALGASVSLTVGVTGLPSPAVQWYKNGVAIAGAQSTTLALGEMTSATAGQYHASATNVLGSATSNTATISLRVEKERLVNVSSRGTAGKDSNTLIAGFVINGSSKKNILLRAVGPTLAGLGVPTALANPRLQLFKGSTVILDNDDWSTGASAAQIATASVRLGAFPLASGTRDAALITSLDPGVYTAHVTTSDASTGVALLEVYDADEAGQSGAKVMNLSSRGPVGTGDDILIVGFVINGATPKKVLIRGVGPALTPLGVTGALVNPKLQLFKGTTVINENDDWSSGTDANDVVVAATRSGAMALTVGSKDAAILVSLAPGVYSAHVRGVADTTGVALVEIYEVP